QNRLYRYRRIRRSSNGLKMPFSSPLLLSLRNHARWGRFDEGRFPQINRFQGFAADKILPSQRKLSQNGSAGKQGARAGKTRRCVGSRQVRPLPDSLEHFIEGHKAKGFSWNRAPGREIIGGEIKFVALRIDHEVNSAGPTLTAGLRGKAIHAADAEQGCFPCQLPALGD